VAAEYGRLLDSYRGVEPAQVITAVPLDAPDVKKLTQDLGVLVGKQVAVKTEVDPGIIGGFIARVGGKLLDGSTRSQLAALRRELVGAEGQR
jgi:F-type H+-transporting ATPase subunit delta